MYFNTTTQTKHSESEIRALNPNTSFGTPFIAPDEYSLVFPAPQPAYDPVTQSVRETAPVLTAKGHYEQTWEVVELFADQEEKDAAIAADAVIKAAMIQTEIITSTQARLDGFAKTRNYDGILSACTYATSSVPKFAAEGQAAVNARDATWATLYTILGEVQSGTRPIPAGFADIEPDLPVLTW